MVIFWDFRESPNLSMIGMGLDQTLTIFKYKNFLLFSVPKWCIQFEDQLSVLCLLAAASLSHITQNVELLSETVM